jgi:hypothetical protein
MGKTIAYTDPVTGARVPQLWVEFDSHPSGREIPRVMDEAAIKKWGAQGQSFVNGALQSFGRVEDQRAVILGTGIWEGLRKAEGPAGDLGVQLLTGSYSTLFPAPKPGDRRNFGSASMIVSLPDNFKFGPAFLGNLLSNLRMTLITRLETGTLFGYQPPQGGERTWREVAMDSRTDLAMEKTFNPKGRVQPTVFIDVRNLFSQKDRTSPTSASDYTYYGIEGPRLDDANYAKYGDFRDRFYAHTPRLVQVGVRMAW